MDDLFYRPVFYWNNYYVGFALVARTEARNRYTEIKVFDVGLVRAVRGGDRILSIERYHYWEVQFDLKTFHWSLF